MLGGAEIVVHGARQHEEEKAQTVEILRRQIAHLRRDSVH